MPTSPASARNRLELYARRRAEQWATFQAGTLRASVHATLPLAEAARAHALREGRANLGKVVLVP